MPRVLKRVSTELDLITQWIWYSENGSVELADRFLRAADQTFHLLATQPESGSRFDVGKVELQGLRRFPVSDGFDNILVFYFPLQDGVDIVRVLHGSRDMMRLFETP